MPLPKCTQTLGRGREELISRWEDMLLGKPEQLKLHNNGRRAAQKCSGDGHPGIIKNLRYACTQIHVLTGYCSFLKSQFQFSRLLFKWKNCLKQLNKRLGILIRWTNHWFLLQIFMGEGVWMSVWVPFQDELAAEGKTYSRSEPLLSSDDAKWFKMWKWVFGQAGVSAKKSLLDWWLKEGIVRIY